MTLLTIVLRRCVFLISLLILTGGGVWADYWYGDFVEDRTLVFSDGAPLRDSTDIRSEVIAELPVGTELIILGNGAGEFRDNGFSSYWYQAACTMDDRSLSGYIPGAYLAMSDIALGEDTIFMFNVIGFDTLSNEFQGEIKVITGGDILDNLFLEAIGAAVSRDFYEYNTELIAFDHSGFTGLQNLVRLSFIYTESGALNPDLLIGWTGEHLVLGPVAMNQFEAQSYIYSTKFILPTDEGGVDETAILESILQTRDEASEDYTVSEDSVTTYIWTGSGFDLEVSDSFSQ